MKDLGLLLAVSAALAVGQWWDRRRVHAEFEGLGHRLRSLRWLPFAGFTAVPGYRRAWFFSVVSDGPDGRRWKSRVAVRFFAGVDVLTREEVGAAAAQPARGSSAQLPNVFGPPAGAAPAERVPYGVAVIGCAILCLLLAGVPYWSLPYQQVRLPDSLYGPGLAAVVIAGGALQVLAARRWRSTWLLLTGSIVATVSLRIAVDLARDPSSHNLFPFEIVIATFVGGVAAGVGIGIGALVARTR